MKTRNYIALCDDGHDYQEVEFSSTYRANSRGNIEAARQEIIRKYGHKRSRQISIITVWRGLV